MKIIDKIIEAKILADQYDNWDKDEHDRSVILYDALDAAQNEINRLRALLGTAEERLQFLDKISSDHILERTEIFTDWTEANILLDGGTVSTIKHRFRKWHTDNIAKTALKLLGEPIEEIENED